MNLKLIKTVNRTRRDGDEWVKFQTAEVGGISYSFDGKFLKKSVQERIGRNYTTLRGILTKYKNGQKLSSARLGFYVFAKL